MSYKPKKVKATLIEKRGQCPYEVGFTIIYGDPVNNTRPSGVCWGITHPLSPIVLACSLGFKSWERNDPDRYYVSCMSKKGTVWRVERLEEEAADPGGDGDDRATELKDDCRGPGPDRLDCLRGTIRGVRRGAEGRAPRWRCR